MTQVAAILCSFYLEILRDEKTVLVLLIVSVHDHDGGAGVAQAGQALQHLRLVPHLRTKLIRCRSVL